MLLGSGLTDYIYKCPRFLEFFGQTSTLVVTVEVPPDPSSSMGRCMDLRKQLQLKYFRIVRGDLPILSVLLAINKFCLRGPSKMGGAKPSRFSPLNYLSFHAQSPPCTGPLKLLLKHPPDQQAPLYFFGLLSQYEMPNASFFSIS